MEPLHPPNPTTHSTASQRKKPPKLLNQSSLNQQAHALAFAQKKTNGPSSAPTKKTTHPTMKALAQEMPDIQPLSSLAPWVLPVHSPPPEVLDQFQPVQLPPATLSPHPHHLHLCLLGVHLLHLLCLHLVDHLRPRLCRLLVHPLVQVDLPRFWEKSRWVRH